MFKKKMMSTIAFALLMTTLISGTAFADVTPFMPEETTQVALPETSIEGVQGFIARIYKIALGRDYDEGGMEFWTNELKGFRSNGLEIFLRITGCPEFTDKNLTDEEYLKVLYSVFFDREPDEGGFEFWLDAMANEEGFTRDYVVACFADSLEWANICADYYILSGGTVKPDSGKGVNAGAVDFIKRLYLFALGREVEEDALLYWYEMLATRQIGGRQMAYQVFTSEEFVNNASTKTDEELVNIFYMVFMDRLPTKIELMEWSNYVTYGSTIPILYNYFSGSYEYADVCIGNDIMLGDYLPMEVSVDVDPGFVDYVKWELDDGANVMNSAVLTPRTTYKVCDVQGSERVYSEVPIPQEDINAIQAFMNEHFDPTWSNAQKAAYALYWIHNNMVYDYSGENTAGTYAVSALVNKAGQCAQYNGAMVELLCYMGYDACLVRGKRGRDPQAGAQHFWGEVMINGETFVMEVGNTKDGDWSYFAVPYSRTSKFIVCGQVMGGS